MSRSNGSGLDECSLLASDSGLAWPDLTLNRLQASSSIEVSESRVLHGDLALLKCLGAFPEDLYSWPDGVHAG